MSGELFELEILGGSTERRFRKLRPEVEAMPWGTMGVEGISPGELIAARSAWTGAAYQEHRTGVACAITLRALIEARAPLDLIAVASRFPLDEMVHVELCARMAMELGGGTEIIHDPNAMVLDVDPSLSPLMRAAECAVRFFFVGEAISIPLLRATWHVSKHPLPKAVMGRIVKDEAAHGTFGFTFLDWALPRLTPEDLDRQQARQIGILREGLTALAPGGVLVYSTCSLEKEENEDVVRAVCGDSAIPMHYRIPGRDPGDGFFAAVIHKPA